MVELFDREVEESVDVMVCDMKEFQALMNYVDEHNDRFSLEHVNSLNFWMFDDFKKEVEKSKI